MSRNRCFGFTRESEPTKLPRECAYNCRGGACVHAFCVHVRCRASAIKALIRLGQERVPVAFAHIAAARLSRQPSRSTFGSDHCSQHPWCCISASGSLQDCTSESGMMMPAHRCMALPFRVDQQQPAGHLRSKGMGPCCPVHLSIQNAAPARCRGTASCMMPSILVGFLFRSVLQQRAMQGFWHGTVTGDSARACSLLQIGAEQISRSVYCVMKSHLHSFLKTGCDRKNVYLLENKNCDQHGRHSSSNCIEPRAQSTVRMKRVLLLIHQACSQVMQPCHIMSAQGHSHASLNRG